MIILRRNNFCLVLTEKAHARSSFAVPFMCSISRTAQLIFMKFYIDREYTEILSFFWEVIRLIRLPSLCPSSLKFDRFSGNFV
jgi:hypothetical protein